MEGFAVSLRLPETAVPSAVGQEGEGGAGGKPEMSDGVFVRLMSLPKGKTLTARALRLVYPPAEPPRPGSSQALAAQDAAEQEQQAQRQQQPQQAPNLRVVWAVMRNLRGLFSGKTGAGRGGKVSSWVLSKCLKTSVWDK